MRHNAFRSLHQSTNCAGCPGTSLKSPPLHGYAPPMICPLSRNIGRFPAAVGGRHVAGHPLGREPLDQAVKIHRLGAQLPPGSFRRGDARPIVDAPGGQSKHTDAEIAGRPAFREVLDGVTTNEGLLRAPESAVEQTVLVEKNRALARRLREQNAAAADLALVVLDQLAHIDVVTVQVLNHWRVFRNNDDHVSGSSAPATGAGFPAGAPPPRPGCRVRRGILFRPRP